MAVLGAVLAVTVAGCSDCRGDGGWDDPAAMAARPADCAPRTCDLPRYPRIASYRIETSLDADAKALLSSVDMAIVDAEVGALVPDGLAGIRRANASLDLLAYLTSEEIHHQPDAEERPLATARFDRIPSLFWLTEPGSTLAAAVDPTTSQLRVADGRAFTVERPASQFYPRTEPTFLLVGDEHVRLVAIEGNELVVERGYRSRAVAHPAGTTIAAHVVFFSGTWMLDLAITAPVHPELGRWRDLLADEAAAMIEAGPWTGVFLDVCFADIGFLNGGLLDVDRDGMADVIKEASWAWSLGMGELIDTLRARLGPRAALVANPGAQDCPHAPLDGILLEGWPIGLPPEFLAFDVGLQRYVSWSKRPDRRAITVANAYSPKIGFGTIAPGADELARTDWPAMRFGLATALMGDGYYAFDNGVFGHYVAWSYDEYHGGGRGRGWLGWPVGAHRELPSGALLREFEHGVAIANPTSGPLDIEVPAGLRRLAGQQDPTVNDGSDVRGRVRLGSRDGLLLARAHPSGP
jgi:hypothetical protein